ncbi:MAG: diacylglycerol kinase [Proteobacteria bacterium]|nr:MAG: diacylglycerol kinase [Pseudomonadota bacterium]
MTAPDTLVVVNEHAGGGAMADTFRRLEHRLEDALGDFDVAFTDGPGHARELARQAAAGGAVRRLLVGGGDGTLNEVVNGVLDEDGAPRAPQLNLGVITGGTGGDFRKTLGVRTADDALGALTGGRVRKLDVARLTYRADDGRDAIRHFINVTSLGVGGLVVRHIPNFKQFGGKLAYAGATLRSLWGWTNPTVRLTLDGGAPIEGPIVTVAIANGRYFGGGMRVAPSAELDDGHLDVTVLGDLSRLELVLMSRTIYDGRHLRHPKVTAHTARVVTAESDTPVYLDVDGEALGRLPARVEILPRALGFITP